MFTRLIVTCGSDRCLVSMMNRRTWQFTSHRKQSATSTDCSMSTVCLLANRSLFLCPGRFGKQSTGPSKDLQASRASFFAKDLLLLSRSTKRDEARCRQIAAAAPGTINLCGKTTPADLAALIQRAEVAVTNDSGSMHVAASLGQAHGERIWPDESGSHRAVRKAGIGCARGFAVFALQLPSPEPMPFRSRLHEAGHVRDGRGARTEDSRGGKTVACAVLSAGPLGAATKSAEDSGRYNACGAETPG